MALPPIADLSSIRYLTTPEGKKEFDELVLLELQEPAMLRVPVILEECEELMGNRQWTGESDFNSRWARLEQLDTELAAECDYPRYRQLIAERDENRCNDDAVALAGDRGISTLKLLVSKARNARATTYAHVFVRDRLWKSAYDRSCSDMTLLIRVSEPVGIPLGMFASADSFRSWYGRVGDSFKNGKLSSEVIVEYAQRETPLPPIEGASAYLLPDDRLYFLSHDAHRVGAAIWRGDPYVKLEGFVTLRTLEYAPSWL